MVYHKVAIVGATGNLGPVIVKALLEHKFEVTAVTFNNPEDPKYADLKAKGVKVVGANIDDKASLVHAFHGIDAVISTVGGALFGKQNHLVDAAIEAGVKRFIPSEFGVSDQDPALKDEALLQPKIHTIHHLEEVAKQGKITWTGIATGPFFDWGLQNGFLQFDLKTHEAVFYDEGKPHITFSNLADIGLWVALTLQHPEKTENKYLQLGTVVATQLEIFEVLEKVTGQKWHVKAHKTTAEAKHLAKEALAKGEQQTFIFQSLFDIIFSGRGSYPLKGDEIFPEYKPLSLEEAIKLVVTK